MSHREACASSIVVRALGCVRTLEVHDDCLFVHAEAGSESIRNQLLRHINTQDPDFRLAITVNPALPLAERSGRPATGVGTLGHSGVGLEI